VLKLAIDAAAHAHLYNVRHPTPPPAETRYRRRRPRAPVQRTPRHATPVTAPSNYHDPPPHLGTCKPTNGLTYGPTTHPMCVPRTCAPMHGLARACAPAAHPSAPTPPVAFVDATGLYTESQHTPRSWQGRRRRAHATSRSPALKLTCSNACAHARPPLQPQSPLHDASHARLTYATSPAISHRHSPGAVVYGPALLLSDLAPPLTLHPRSQILHFHSRRPP
jgi:hypothetical protein